MRVFFFSLLLLTSHEAAAEAQSRCYAVSQAIARERLLRTELKAIGLPARLLRCDSASQRVWLLPLLPPRYL